MVSLYLDSIHITIVPSAPVVERSNTTGTLIDSNHNQLFSLLGLPSQIFRFWQIFERTQAEDLQELLRRAIQHRTP
jgi:hypothetical protein